MLFNLKLVIYFQCLERKIKVFIVILCYSNIFQGLPYYIFWDGLAILRRIVKYYNWKRISIIGHSLGSAIGFLYAASYSDDIELLIAIDTVAPVVFDPSEIVKNIGPMLDKFVLLIFYYVSDVYMLFIS